MPEKQLQDGIDPRDGEQLTLIPVGASTVNPTPRPPKKAVTHQVLADGSRVPVEHEEPEQELKAKPPRRLFDGTHLVAPDEPTDCLRCGLTVERALYSKTPPAVITHPGWIRCECSGPDPYSATEELLRQKGSADDERTREIRECFYEDAHREVKPASQSSGRTRERERRSQRPEQEWQGWAEPETERRETLEKLVVVLKGKVPRRLKEQLERYAGRSQVGVLFRRLLEKHLPHLDAAHEVEYGSDTAMLKVLVTREQADLWAGVKAGLKQKTGLHVSNADLMAAVMLREWE